VGQARPCGDHGVAETHDSEGPHLLVVSSLIDAVRTHLPADYAVALVVGQPVSCGGELLKEIVEAMLPPVWIGSRRTRIQADDRRSRGDPVLAACVKLDALKLDLGPDLIVIPELGDGAASVDGNRRAIR
jgi:hypothetical protein